MKQIEEFVKDLNGRFKHHISDELMIAYLTHEFNKEKFKSDKDALLQNIAYRASIFLFENLLEHACKEIINGHHVAQKFCEYFKD